MNSSNHKRTADKRTIAQNENDFQYYLKCVNYLNAFDVISVIHTPLKSNESKSDGCLMKANLSLVLLLIHSPHGSISIIFVNSCQFNLLFLL